VICNNIRNDTKFNSDDPLTTGIVYDISLKIKHPQIYKCIKSSIKLNREVEEASLNNLQKKYI
jgi:hypothetical protein